LTNVKKLTGIGGTVQYNTTDTYDVFDRRIGIKENGTQTWTFYDGANAYADFNGGGTLTMRYLNGLGMDERYARQDTAGPTVDWYLTDNVGSVRQMVRTDGTVRDDITYTAFGTPTDTHANQGDRFKFTGREWDAGAGQYYYRARYYGADVGRFRSQDPMGFAAGDADLYRYVVNSPTNSTDPTGLYDHAKPPEMPTYPNRPKVTYILLPSGWIRITTYPGIPGISPPSWTIKELPNGPPNQKPIDTDGIDKWGPSRPTPTPAPLPGKNVPLPPSKPAPPGTPPINIDGIDKTTPPRPPDPKTYPTVPPPDNPKPPPAC
jgi:RHS repeat-associated protein